jgi:hypothetical protein
MLSGAVTVMRVPIRETNCVFGTVAAGLNNFYNTMQPYRTRGHRVHFDSNFVYRQSCRGWNVIANFHYEMA